MSDGSTRADQLAQLLDTLVAATEAGGGEALDQQIEALSRTTSGLGPDEWLVLCAERLQHSPRHRRSMLERLGPAISRLSAASDPVSTLRALAVTAQIQLAERLYAEAETVIDLLARRAADPDTGSRLYRRGARMLQAHLELERGNVAQAAGALDALVAELDPELRQEAPLYEFSLRTLQVRAHSALGAFDALESAVAELESVIPEPVPLTCYYRGVAAEATGELEEAAACYRDACDSDADVDIQVAAQVALARLVPSETLGRLATASALAEGDDCKVIAALALAMLRAGQLGQARQLGERLRELDHEATLLVQAEILCATGPRKEAMKRVGELMKHATARGLTGMEAQAHLFAARLDGSLESRAAHAERARQLATRCGDMITLGRAQAEQALLEVDLHDSAAAMKSAAVALEIAEIHRRPDLAAAAELAMGLAHKQRGQPAEADRHLGLALRAAQRLGLLGVASRVLIEFGRGEEAKLLLKNSGVEP